MATILPLSASDARPATPRDRSHVRLELTRRGRLIVTGAVFLLGILVAVIGLALLGGPFAFADEGEAGAVVTVESGYTLSHYAQQYAPEGMGSQEFIQEVRRLNDLPTSRLTAGEQITLPEGSLALE